MRGNRMKIMGRGIAVFSFLLVFLFSGFLNVQAQDDMSASGLLTDASRLLAGEKYGEAVPYLTEYVKRMESSEDERVESLVQEVRLKLGKIMLSLEDPDGAVSYLESYTSHTPVNKWRESHKLLAVSLFDLGEYEKCITAVTNAFSEPPVVETKKDKTVDFEKLDKEELGGLTARQLKRAEAYAEELDQDPFSNFDAAPEEEPEFTEEDLILLNMTLAEAYTGLEEWESAIEPYSYVIDHASNEDRKGYAIMQMVNALIKIDRYQEAQSFVLQLYRTNARYDIRVNMALLNAASALFNAKEYDSALTLYRMILPREVLVQYQAERINEIRQKAGLPSVQLQVVTNELGRVETLFGARSSQSAEQIVGSGDGAGLTVKPMELIELEERIGTLLSLPPYETDVMYRTAQLYAEVGRPWEALILFKEVLGKDPESDLGQRAFFEMLQVMIDPLQQYNDAETQGLAFLKAHREGIFPRQVAYALTGMYQKLERWADIKKLLPYIQHFELSSEPLVERYACELYYMQAVADLMLLNYPAAEAGFKDVLTRYPGSHQDDNATYWHAMSLLFLQKYSEALDEFESYPTLFPSGHWVVAASFRGGICLFGLERYEEAQKRFTHVIETWPDSAVYPDACSLRGDILGSQGMLDEAVRDYREAMAKAQKPEQATYAVFQMCGVFESESRYDEIIDAVNGYLDQYKEKADIAKAMYWIGKTRIQQGLVNEAVTVYLDTVVKYGGDVRQDGVDLIISELVQVSSRRLEDEDLLKLENQIKADIDATESNVVKLRLRVLLAQLNGTEIDLGSKLLAEKVDLESASPPVLAVVCDASFEVKDYSRAKEILNLFQTRFEDSEYMSAAYKLRAFDLYSAGDLDGAMKLVEETQATYGDAFDVGWAQLMKGKILLTRNQLDAARDAFMGVLNVRAWRGEAYAEATYYLGEVEEKAGDPRKAFAWYQRAYFQYKGHAGGYWAAEAYLASARCLQKLGLENDRRNTYRAMLFDSYVNRLPQAETARRELGSEETATIQMMIDAGVRTNVTVTIDGETGE
ncbi:MAG: tetratricopeptide repeat protein [Kiritimatiellales bacterium]